METVVPNLPKPKINSCKPIGKKWQATKKIFMAMLRNKPLALPKPDAVPLANRVIAEDGTISSKYWMDDLQPISYSAALWRAWFPPKPVPEEKRRSSTFIEI